MSDLFSDKGARDALRRREYQQGPVVETPSLAEAFWLDYESQVAEFNTNSEVDAERRFNHDQNAEIRDMIHSGEIPENVVRDARKVLGYTSDYDEEVTGIDYQQLKRWANENIEGATFDSEDQAMIETMRKERDYRNNKMDSADFWGKAYGMAGSIWGMTDDPVALIVSFTPFGGVKNSQTVLGAAARAAVREGAVAMAAEVPLQVQAYEFSKRIESGYTVSDAFTNIALAGLLGGAVGAGMDAGIHVMKRSAPATVAEQMSSNQRIIDEMDQRGKLKGDEAATLDLLKDQNRTLAAMDPDADAEAILKDMDNVETRASEEPEYRENDVTRQLDEEAEAAPEPDAKPRMRVVAEVGDEVGGYADDLPDFEDDMVSLRIDDEGNLVEESLADSLSREDLTFDQELDRLDKFVDCLNA